MHTSGSHGNNVSDLLSRLAATDATREAMGVFHREDLSKLHITGLNEPATVALLAALNRSSLHPLLVVAPNAPAAEKLYSGCRALVEINNKQTRMLEIFPDWELLPYEEISPSREIIARRIDILSRLLDGENMTIIAPVPALMRKSIHEDRLGEARIVLERGDEIIRKWLVQQLLFFGYQRCVMVERRGHFSVRGSIIDVFIPLHEHPIRLELMGNTLESIRFFDVDTQRSIRQVERTYLVPCAEMLVDPVRRSAGIKNLNRLKKQLHGAKMCEELTRRIHDFKHGLSFPGMENWTPYFHRELISPLHHVPRKASVVVIEPELVNEAAEMFEQRCRDSFEELKSTTLLPAPEKYFLGADEITKNLRSRTRLVVTALDCQTGKDYVKKRVKVSRVPSFNRKLDVMNSTLRDYLKKDYDVFLCAADTGRGRRMAEMLTEYSTPYTLKPAIGAKVVKLVVAPVEAGFVFHDEKLAVVSETDFTGGRFVRREPTMGRSPSTSFLPFTEIRKNDLVVHINQGVACYEGETVLTVEGYDREFLSLQFARGDRLYVPTDQAHLVQRYVGGEGHRPQLSRLGSGQWERTKRRVKKSVDNLAKDLHRIHMVRSSREGYAFSPDTPWQNELEEAFEYEETIDQTRAIDEVKDDMESTKPMNRLLCGDVGYGKTEIAVRAAFKAIMDGKQVAMLVPTTILAEQHMQVFRDRFGVFPVTVESLSRFKSAKEQREVLARLKRGEIEMVIGTHRLIQGDVTFKNLGLLIIDEEQRFGVQHKTIIQKFCETVDVLTMTATPIPRTLHMSLTGLKDMSLVDTPPEYRLAIKTYVTELNENTIKHAAQRELARGGQVYFVHNRVQTIEGVGAYLRQLLPGIKVAVAHGQMPKRQLEKVMVAFLNRENDILLCTSIIESGLDIPNVNTIFVHMAHRFGLADLYQLRGRVGRARHQAYSYFFYPRGGLISTTARRRFTALQEFTELGSGFKIAMRDLEIRGAGNVLGPEQHGFMQAVGFELYCQLLKESVDELKRNREGAFLPKNDLEPEISIGVSAYIPSEYVPDSRQKIEFYKRLAYATSLEEAEHVSDDLKDRFGPFPPELEHLTAFVRLKILCCQAEVLKISRWRETVKLAFSSKVDVRGLCRFASMKRQSHDFSLRCGPGGTVILSAGSSLRLSDGYQLICELEKLLSLFTSGGIM